MSKTPLRCLNIYAGPGTGKSTTAAALFAELKYNGYNTEIVLEYAKDAAWERRGKKFFSAQEYIFGKQHFRMSRVANEVDFIITDCPILMGLVYMPEDFNLPSLRNTIREAYDNYDNIDVLLHRSKEKPFNPKGRNQDEQEAMELDDKISDMLTAQSIWPYEMTFDRSNVQSIIEIMKSQDWIK